MNVENVIWKLPRENPTKPGEYRSAFDPRGFNENMRRWWNGSNWSNPYGTDGTENDKRKAKSKNSPIKPYWLENE